MECRQERRRGLNVEAVIGKGVLQPPRGFVLFSGRRVQQKEAIARRVREQAQEIRFRDDQLALKQAVLERRHDAESDAIEFELLAELAVQHIGHGVGVGNGWNGARGGFRFQFQPRVLRLPLGTLKGEVRCSEKCRRRRQNARTARLIQIQTTGVVARAHAKGHQLDAVERRKIQRDQWQHRVRHQREPARPRRRAIPAKGVQRDDREGGRCNQRDT